MSFAVQDTSVSDCPTLAQVRQTADRLAGKVLETPVWLGPLRARLDGKKVGLIVCGSNIDSQRFSELVARGAEGAQ